MIETTGSPDKPVGNVLMVVRQRDRYSGTVVVVSPPRAVAGKNGCAMDEVLLKTRRFDVIRREYEVPGRGAVKREFVAHPGAVVLLPLLDGDRVVMIRNYRFAVGKHLLELPAGTMEIGEEPRFCAARELEEETGYTSDDIQPLCEFYSSPGITDELMRVFVARQLRRGSQSLDETEQIEVEILSLTDAWQATMDGRIVDAKSIAALHVYRYSQS